ncbi:hypothetical protein RFI_15903 [Reticulomyxa filosa]|uniref:Pentatricopeptide repeat-containing protein n=1 Tax=Reticulomyxa filosa TaxID=46433 RepID=X6N5L3_RETFI|nr:hypothetical protein RFI_15903 [Reticulomyxa filosa]|eukprot:ETO21301.1 hypothetical protein RFI_15903 [Reticulomyxa filosa]
MMTNSLGRESKWTPTVSSVNRVLSKSRNAEFLLDMMKRNVKYFEVIQDEYHKQTEIQKKKFEKVNKAIKSIVLDDLDIVLNVDYYNALLSVLVVNKDMKNALNIYNEMTVMEMLKPNVTTLNMLLEGCDRCEYHELAKHFYFNEMLAKYQLTPNTATFFNLFGICEKFKDVQLAEELFYGHILNNRFGPNCPLLDDLDVLVKCLFWCYFQFDQLKKMEGLVANYSNSLYHIQYKWLIQTLLRFNKPLQALKYADTVPSLQNTDDLSCQYLKAKIYLQLLKQGLSDSEQNKIYVESIGHVIQQMWAYSTELVEHRWDVVHEFKDNLPQTYLADLIHIYISAHILFFKEDWSLSIPYFEYICNTQCPSVNCFVLFFFFYRPLNTGNV